MRITGKPLADLPSSLSVPAKTAALAHQVPVSNAINVSRDHVSVSDLGKTLQQDDTAQTHTPLRVAREIPASEVTGARSRRAQAAYRVAAADETPF